MSVTYTILLVGSEYNNYRFKKDLIGEDVKSAEEKDNIKVTLMKIENISVFLLETSTRDPEAIKHNEYCKSIDYVLQTDYTLIENLKYWRKFARKVIHKPVLFLSIYYYYGRRKIGTFDFEWKDISEENTSVDALKYAFTLDEMNYDMIEPKQRVDNTNDIAKTYVNDDLVKTDTNDVIKKGNLTRLKQLIPYDLQQQTTDNLAMIGLAIKITKILEYIKIHADDFICCVYWLDIQNANTKRLLMTYFEDRDDMDVREPTDAGFIIEWHI